MSWLDYLEPPVWRYLRGAYCCCDPWNAKPTVPRSYSSGGGWMPAASPSWERTCGCQKTGACPLSETETCCTTPSVEGLSFSIILPSETQPPKGKVSQGEGFVARHFAVSNLRRNSGI